MPNETKVIRDFIYMDVERLNSLYSQTFGGLVSQLIKSQSHTGTNTEDELPDAAEEPQEVIAKRLVSESRHEAKNVVFNDYLYTQFEESIAGAILQPKGLTPGNCYSLLNSAFLIKVQGPAEIEDYQRFTSTAEKFLTLVSDIALVSQSGTVKTLIALTETQVQELQQQSRNSTGGERSRINSQIAEIQRELKEYQDPEKLKRKLTSQLGLDIDPEFMKGIARLFQHFSPDNFEVTISPVEDSEGVVFRGVLDKNLLRIQPEYLRVLYEGSVSKPWTIVGEITHFPRSVSSLNDTPFPETNLDTENGKENDPGMKDILRTVFRSLADMESNFFESKKRVEIRVRPLAIYQEVQIALQ